MPMVAVSKNVAVNEKNSPNISAIVSKTGCNVNNGAIDLIVQPNTEPGLFVYNWNDLVTTEDRVDLAAGDYTVEVQDANLCRANARYQITVRPPLKNNICLVTVDSATTTNLVVWEKLEASGIDYYNIYREAGQAGNFMLIDSVDYSLPSMFNDVVASPTAISWRYRISAVNDCGVEGPLSTVHKTIHLNFTKLNDFVTRLDWNHYSGLQFGSYIISRYTDLDGYQIVDTVPSIISTYNDFPLTQNGLDYFIGFEINDPCTVVGKAEDFNYVRSNRSRGVFNPGFGTGASNNSIEELNFDDAVVRLYPNPIGESFQVYLEGLNDVKYHITDAHGRILTEGELNSGVNQLSAQGWAKGVYFINLIQSNNIRTVKFVK